MAQKIFPGQREFGNVYEIVLLADAETGQPWSHDNPMPVVGMSGPGGAFPQFVYQAYIAVASGAGYSEGDFLQQIEEWDVTTSPASYINTIWRNITTEFTLTSPPPASNVAPIAGSASSVVVTNFPATQAISGNVGILGTVPVSAASLPLPTGAATVTAQNSQTTLLGQIDTDLVTMSGAGGTGITQPAGGTGLQGWLSGILNALRGVISTSRTWTLGSGTDSVTVAGTVAVSALPALPAGSNAIGTVSVTNFPSTQTVAGVVSVSNFPATQPVSGTLNIGNNPGVQGLAAAGAAVSGNPVLMGGTDGTNARALFVDTTGRAVVSSALTPSGTSGTAAVVAAATDYVLVGANATRRIFAISNNHATAILYVNFVGAAYLSGNYAGFPIHPLGSILLDVAVPNTTVHVASDTAGCPYTLVEA
jgi:hypothetical protein